MKKILFLLMIALLFTGLFAAPASRAAADGAEKVTFYATSHEVCPYDPRCSYGEVRTLPNGKDFRVGWIAVIQFTAEDPRWTAECLFSGDPFPPAAPYTRPIMGSFVCTPYAEELSGGWWEGTLSQVLVNGVFQGTWRAKGYGDFDGLIAVAKHSVGDEPMEVTIIELPGY